MYRRMAGLLVVVLALGWAVFPIASPANAFHSRAVDPASIDPTSLRLPASALPPGAVLDHDAVSSNADADGAPSADKFNSQFSLVHANQTYAQLGRLTGYRMDMHYTVEGTAAGTEYLASVFPSPAAARAAMTAGYGDGSLIQILGYAPLPHPCAVGDSCLALSGPFPGADVKVVGAVFVRGPILVETGTQVPSASFSAIISTLEKTLYGLLAAADLRVQAALKGTTAEDTPTSTVTATARATDTPVPPSPTATPRASTLHCKKGSKVVNGKCKKPPYCRKGYALIKGKCKKHR